MSDADLESLLQRMPVDEPLPERGAELRLRVLEEFDQSRRRAEASFALRLWKQGKRIMTHPITRTASLAAAVVFCMWAFSPTPAGAAFSDLVKPLLQSKSATYKIIVSLDGEKDTTFKGYYLAPGRTRQENELTISITDAERGKMVSLTPMVKQAIVFDIVKSPAGTEGGSPFIDLMKMLEGLRGNKSMEVRELGEKVIDGKKAFGFAFAQGGMTAEMWGDAETKRILRTQWTANGVPKSTIVMTDFVFDVPLDEKLFATDPPEGWKVVKGKFNPAPTSEAEFTSSLKKFAEMTGGELPAGFDGASLGMGFSKAFMKMAEGKGDVNDEMMKVAMELGRGLTFASTQTAESDAHYAGRNVKGGTKAPIFWYKPKGEGKYRVLSADWTWAESESAPDVKDAVRLGGFPKSAYKKDAK
jgi:outer membrane lipoprotein-sorting protein